MVAVPAPSGAWSHYCMYAALGDRDYERDDDNRWNRAIVAAPPA